MKKFDPVVIACDNGSWTLGLAIRSALELFCLRAYFHFCVQKRNVFDFLGGDMPESEYVVLCSHGLGSEGDEPPEKMKMGFNVVDKIEGEWKAVEVALTPRNITELVNLPGRKVLALGCANGREPLAKAFLESGCKAYMGAVEPVDQDSATLFAINFFYHLLSSERDPTLKCTEQEAVERARSIDVDFREGTHLFRYYERE